MVKFMLMQCVIKLNYPSLLVLSALKKLQGARFFFFFKFSSTVHEVEIRVAGPM